jgi:putative ABC transport system permease protein
MVALRIARREARRAKGRTLLIIVMIALPVAALAFAASTYDMYKLTPAESLTRQMGTASAIMNWETDDSILPAPDGQTPPTNKPQPHTASSLLSHLPAGSRLSPFWSTGLSVTTATGIGNVGAYGIDTSDAMTDGMVRIDSGRAPRADNEVLASPGALARLGAHVGGTITTAPNSDPGTRNFGQKSYVVVGEAEVGGQLNQYLVFRPSQMTDQNSWLVQTPGPVTESISNALGSIGIQVTSRELEMHPPAGDPTYSTDPTVAGFSLFGVGTIVAGLGLLEVVLLAGPAFAVGAKRRQRDLALVATTGGTPSTLRRIVLADGIVGGVAAAIVGTISGLAVAFLGRPYLENHLTHVRFGAYRVYPLALVAVIGLALATGLLGALVPAFTASRQDVVAALTGRRGIAKSRLLWLFLGVAGIVLGAVSAFAGASHHSPNIVLFGLVVGEFGIVLCTPTLIGFVARFGRFLPVAPRIALRDTARRRAAAAPAISAVMAAVAGSVALTVYLGASDNRGTTYQPQLPIGSMYVTSNGTDSQNATIKAVIDKDLPGASTVAAVVVDRDKLYIFPKLPLAHSCPFSDGADLSAADQAKALADSRCTPENMSVAPSSYSPLVTIDPAVLTATLGMHGQQVATASAELASGGAVVNDARLVVDGKVTLEIDQEADASPRLPATMTLPAVVIPSDIQATVVIAPDTAKALRLPTMPLGVVVTPLKVPTQAQEDKVDADLNKLGLPSVYTERGPTRDKQIVAIVLAIAAGVIALGAAAIATGLASVDGRGDLRTLGAIGATPRVRRLLALSQSGVIAGLGSFLGAIAGFGAGAAVLFGLNRVYAGKWPAPIPYPIEVPWLNLGISLVAVPLVAILGAGLLTRSRLPIERRAD